jgi:hypothetical protein
MDNKELTQYCDDMRDLFVSEGWSWVKADLENLRKQTRDIEALNTVEELYYQKGVAHAASIILNLPEAVTDLEQSLEENA